MKYGLFIALMAASVAIADPSNVAKYQVPALVDEINANIVTPLNTEAGIKDSVVTTTEIKDGTIVNADVSASAAIASTKLATDVVTKDSNRILTEGYFDVVNTTQLVFVASGVTNVVDADIRH